MNHFPLDDAKLTSRDAQRLPKPTLFRPPIMLKNMLEKITMFHNFQGAEVIPAGVSGGTKKCQNAHQEQRDKTRIETNVGFDAQSTRISRYQQMSKHTSKIERSNQYRNKRRLRRPKYTKMMPYRFRHIYIFGYTFSYVTIFSHIFLYISIYRNMFIQNSIFFDIFYSLSIFSIYFIYFNFSYISILGVVLPYWSCAFSEEVRQNI